MKASGRMAEAPCDERGRVVGGKKGDQTGREVRITRYVANRHVSYRNWKFVIRCTDPADAKAAATFVTRACRNNKIGYSNYRNRQKGINKRNSLYYEAKEHNFDPRKIRKKVDTSCTPLCLIGFSAAGIDMHYTLRAKYRCRQTGTYTGTYTCRTVNAEALKKSIRLVNRKYRKQGKKPPFKIIKLTPCQFKKYKKNLKRGDVICSGHHTAMVL